MKVLSGMTLFRNMVFSASLAGFAAITAVAGAQDKSGTMKGLALSNDKPIQIESDKLEIREQEKRALFDGNVQVVQDTITLKAGHMIVYYNGDSGEISSGASKIDRIVVNGNVSLVSGTQSARGETGSFDMASENLVLEGKQVVLADGPNVFTGCKLVVQMKSGEAKLSSCGGRVRIQLDPKSRKTN
jgi:lipopolysaccharide export system protein LptA